MEQDPDFITLSRQFKATAMELISVLEQVKPCMSVVVVLFLFYLFIYFLGKTYWRMKGENNFSGSYLNAFSSLSARSFLHNCCHL